MAITRFAHPETPFSVPPPSEMKGATSAATISPGSPTLYHRIFRARRSLERQSFDQEYVDRLSRGEPAAAAHFIGYFTKLLVMKMRARMRSNSAAEDIAQETLCRVLQYVKVHKGIEHPERLGGFVNSVGENVLLEFFRDSRRFQQVPENTPEPVEPAIDAELNCITHERKQLIRKVLATLRPSDRLVLEKVFLLEQDKDEICAELKIDRNYLRVQVHRALARLRKVLNEEGGSLPPLDRKASAV